MNKNYYIKKEQSYIYQFSTSSMTILPISHTNTRAIPQTLVSSYLHSSYFYSFLFCSTFFFLSSIWFFLFKLDFFSFSLSLSTLYYSPWKESEGARGGRRGVKLRRTRQQKEKLCVFLLLIVKFYSLHSAVFLFLKMISFKRLFPPLFVLPPQVFCLIFTLFHFFPL